MPASVKQADNDVLLAERTSQIMRKPTAALVQLPGTPASVTIQC